MHKLNGITVIKVDLNFITTKVLLYSPVLYLIFILGLNFNFCPVSLLLFIFATPCWHLTIVHSTLKKGTVIYLMSITPGMKGQQAVS